jgi:cytochrome P450
MTANRTLVAKSVPARIGDFLAGRQQALADPYPLWAQARATGRAINVRGTVVLTHYADVRELLGDNNVFYSRAQNRTSPRYEQAREGFSPDEAAAFDCVLEHEYRQVVRLDPPEHACLRRTVQPPFNRRRLINEMKSTVQERVDINLERLAAEGLTSDFRRFAQILPIEVLGHILGVPLRDLEAIRDWTDTIAAQKLSVDDPSVVVAAGQAYLDLSDYIDELLEFAGRNPTPGLVTDLLAAEEAGRLDRPDLIGVLTQLFLAGHETTTNLLTIGFFELLDHPEQWAALCADPSIVPQAVEELLRYTSPVHLLQYLATSKRSFDEVTIEPGDTIIGVLASANRDPAVFADPDKLDIVRPDSGRHVALGFGPHFCLGATLARIEAELTFGALATRYPNTTSAVGVLEWTGSAALRTPQSFPVHLGS